MLNIISTNYYENIHNVYLFFNEENDKRIMRSVNLLLRTILPRVEKVYKNARTRKALGLTLIKESSWADSNFPSPAPSRTLVEISKR